MNDGHVLGQERSGGQDVAHDADGRARVEHAPESGPGMVADEAADFRLAGGHGVAAEGHEDLAIVVPEVAVGGDRPEVDPLADVGVAQETLVILIGEAVDDRRLDLAADPAIRADRHPAPDVGAEKLGVAADEARTLDPGERLDPGAGGDRDRPVGRVENRIRDRSAPTRG